MPRFTGRDLAELVIIAFLVVAVAALAIFGPTRWAIAGLGLLIGVSVIASRVQFAARRPAYQRLRRESRATREASKRIVHLASRIPVRVDALRAEIVAAREESVEGANGALKPIRDELARMAAESAALRSELDRYMQEAADLTRREANRVLREVRRVEALVDAMQRRLVASMESARVEAADRYRGLISPTQPHD